MVNKLVESHFYENLIQSNDEVTDEFLVNSLDHTVIIEKYTENQYKYKLKILVESFVPTDFKLKLKGKSLLVKATREANRTRNESDVNEVVSNVKEYEEFKREINLPDFVINESLVCYLEVYEDNQNYLFIEGLIDENINLSSLKNFVQNKKRPLKSSNMKENMQKTQKHDFYLSKMKDSNVYNKVFKSIDEITDPRVENYSSNGCLKYKFELRDFDSNNINISIRNRNILVVYAYDKYLDLNGKPAFREFNQEINLPNNIELCNIRNCFDETLGTLRIEIPLKFSSKNKVDSKKQNNNHENYEEEEEEINENDKYLELMFDLKDFKYENIEFFKNKDQKNVLIVKAIKENNEPFMRKYVLPDWVGTENIKIFEESKQKGGIKKHLLILNLPFV